MRKEWTTSELRELMRLHDVEGYTFVELAPRFGRSARAIGRACGRARKMGITAW